MVKVKVLFIMQLPPPVHGASMVNKYIKESNLIRDSFTTSLLPLKFVDRIDQIGAFSFRKVWLMLMFVFSLLKRLRTFKPDLVYFTIAPFGFAFYRDALFIAIIKQFNVKILLHLHGKGIRDEAKTWWKRMIYQKTFEGTNVITLSHMLDSDIDEVFSGQCINLGNGIPIINELNEMDAKSTKRDNNPVEILFLSNFVESKGILVLIQSVEMLIKSGLEFELNLVGNSADLSIDDVKQIVLERHLEEYVNVLGPLYGNDKWLKLLKADIFAFPTYFKNECFPLVILEAMQAGNAIVSTSNGAISDIIDGCGVTVKERDPVDLANALRDLIVDEKKRIRLAKNAIKKFEKEYTLEVFEHNFVKIIKRINNN